MTGGVSAALGEALEDQEEAADLVQAVLFEDLEPHETGALDAPSPLTRALTSKAGRPRGSRNRRTEAVTSWLLSQHRHPLQVMMEAYSMSPAELAGRLGLSKARVQVQRDGEKVIIEYDEYDNEVLLDLFKLQVRMAEAVAPYVAQKQPMAVQVDGKAHLTIGFEGVSLPARGPALGNSGVVEGEAMHLRLPTKSDEQSRKED